MEISRAYDRGDLVTDDRAALREQLEAVTGERIAALEGIGEMPREVPDKGAEIPEPEVGMKRAGPLSPAKDRVPVALERERGAGMDFGL